MLQTSAQVISLFSKVCKPYWPRKKLGKFLRPVTNHLHDQFKQSINTYGHNFKVCSTPINNDHMLADDMRDMQIVTHEVAT